MMFTKFHENRYMIDGEINDKHSLLVSSGLRYIVVLNMFLLENEFIYLYSIMFIR